MTSLFPFPGREVSFALQSKAQLGVGDLRSPLLPQGPGREEPPWFAFPASSSQSCCGSTRGSWSPTSTPSSLLSLSVCGPRKPCREQRSKTRRTAREENGSHWSPTSLPQMRLSFLKPKAMGLQTDMLETSLLKCLTKRRIKEVPAVGCEWLLQGRSR